MHRKQKKTIGIGLLGKGSTNHLHRTDVVQALQANGFQVTFIVREDYVSLLTRLESCAYVTCRIGKTDGWRGAVSHFCENIRFAYPSNDIGRRGRLLVNLWKNLRPLTLLRNLLCFALARFRASVLLCSWLEGMLFRPLLVEGLDPADYDLMLLLGIGTVNSEMEGVLTRWANTFSIPQIHIVGNYDNLTSKGFRGIMPERLLVWGPQMKSDAITFHGIDPEKIRMIGSLRYNGIVKSSFPERADFYSRLGLDPARKTIVFAGFVYDTQYFEILDIYRRFFADEGNYQLVIRLYPNKAFMNSVYIEPILHYAKALPYVYVSCADPHFKDGITNREVIQIEETELWPILRYCDVLIDYYSTIAIEGAIFNKPCIHMHYFPKISSRGFEKEPVPIMFWKSRHNRRIMSYGAVDVAQTREELIALIRLNMHHPEKNAEARKAMLAQECGSLDGRAYDRLIHECQIMLSEEHDQVNGSQIQ